MIEKLKNFASQLGFEDLEKKLNIIYSSLQDSKAPLILPLIGEFSAGKTTLINALSDSKALECASEPTTATIYALHFGAMDIRAIIHNQDGTITETDNISTLHNKDLIDATIVEVFDTSSKVPSSIMLVDTPGLSSHDIKHRQNLVDFLPQADGILLVIDVNQTITKSLTDFAKTIELSKRPLYIVLTQCDTKSSYDIELQMKYILDNTELHISGFACVSAKTNELEEFYKLLENIQEDKTHILVRVNEYRCKEIAREMIKRIETLLHVDESDNAIEDTIREQQLNLNKLRRDLDNIIKDIESEIENEGRNISRQFEDTIFSRLETIVTGSSENFDAEAISAINNTSSLLLNEFRTNVLSIFKKYSSKCDSISSVDISQYNIDGMTGCYNINLNEVGHQYDSKIGIALKVLAVAGTVVATAGVASAAAGTATAGTTATGATTAGKAMLTTAEGIMVAADVADTATDVGSIVSNRRTVDKICKIVEKGKRYGSEITKGLDTIDEVDGQVGQRVGSKKGFVESLVGFVTDRTMGRPQRRRAITEYIDGTLIPLFKSEITRISKDITNSVKDEIMANSKANLDAITASLEQLRNERNNQKKEFEEKIKILRTIKRNLVEL